MNSILRTAGCIAALMACASAAQAALSTFTGTRSDTDLTTPSYTPSGAALAAHDAFTKNAFVKVMGIESFTDLTGAPPLHSTAIGATISCDDIVAGNNSCDLSSAADAGRYDTTSGSGKFLSSLIDEPGTITIAFDSAVSAFGLYLTDVGDFGGSFDVILIDSTGKQTTKSLNSQGSQAADGSLIFFGFYDDSAKYTAVKLVNGDASDVFGIDDLIVGAFNPTPPTNVPEPTTPLLALGALTALGAARRLRR